jgi:hypothetical protein
MKHTPTGRQVQGDLAIDLAHGILSQEKNLHPTDFGMIQRLRLTFDQAAFEGMHGDPEIRVGVIVKPDLLQRFDLNAQFLLPLSP